MSKTNWVFATIAVIALVLSCISISNSLVFSDKSDKCGVGVRLDILDRWVYEELWEFADGGELDNQEFSLLAEIATVGWTTAYLLREYQNDGNLAWYDAADNSLVHASYLIDEYTELKYGK